MKINVDLTKNRLFSTNNNSNNQSNLLDIDKLLLKGKKSIWNIQNIYKEFNELDKQKERIIVTGNKEYRKEIEFYRKSEDCNYCDCCGKMMNLKPWCREIGICKECEKYVQDKYIDNCLWRKEFD